MGKFEQADAFVKIGLVGALVFADQLQALALLFAPLRGLAVEEVSIDTTIKLVDVHGIDAVLQPVVVGLNPADRIFVVLLFVAMADSQGLRHPGEHLVVETQAVEQFGEPFLQDLLPGVGLGTFPLRTAAVVVDVAALLDLGDHRTAAMPAANQAGEGEVVLWLAIVVDIPAREHRLHFIPQLPTDNWLVVTFIGFAVPDELAHVDWVAQHLVHAALRHLVAGLAKGEPFSACHAGDLTNRVASGCVPLEHLTDHGRQFRVRFDGLLTVITKHVAISERRIRRPDPLLCLLGHALAGLFREVVDIILRHQHLDAVHELLRGAGICGKDDVLLDEVDLQVQFVKGHPVLQVTVQAIGFLDQDDAGLGVLM